MSILSFPEEQHNQKYSPHSCATCGSIENLRGCDRCQLVAYCSKYCENKNWYNHKHGCEQNQEVVVEVIETKGYKQLVRETQSRRLQSPYNPVFDLPNSESRERYESYPMQRSNDIGLTIRNVYSISLLFDLGFLSISFLFLLIFIFGSILFLFCFCLCVFSSFEQEARMNFSDQNWSAVGRRHRRSRRRHR